MSLYEIVGLVTDLDCKYPRTIEQAKAYKTEASKEPDITIHLSDEYYKGFSENYPEIDEETREYICTGAEFYNALMSFGGFFLHSSAVMIDGKAYLFSAPSGTGKSTHTSLWLEKFGDRAKILNDDKPAIRIINDEIRVFGTPWSGKADSSVNTDVALAGICFLERDTTNHIEEISKAEGIAKVMNQTIRPSDRAQMSQLLDTLDIVISRTPIYKMGCNISLEAAEVAYEAMKR